jgi:hypothetical protein
VSLQIYDIIGKQVLNQRPTVNSNAIIQFDASKLASGVYFVKLVDEGAIRIQKIILK